MSESRLPSSGQPQPPRPPGPPALRPPAQPVLRPAHQVPVQPAPNQHAPVQHAPNQHPSVQHAPAQPAVQGPAKIAGVPIMHNKPTDEELESISLVEEEPSEGGEKKLQAFGVTGFHQAKQFKREANKTGAGAVRVKSFRGKLSDQGLGYLDDAINEWLDNHPEIEIKFVTSSVGTFEGKIREPALILNLWY